MLIAKSPVLHPYGCFYRNRRRFDYPWLCESGLDEFVELPEGVPIQIELHNRPAANRIRIAQDPGFSHTFKVDGVPRFFMLTAREFLHEHLRTREAVYAEVKY